MPRYQIEIDTGPNGPMNCPLEELITSGMDCSKLPLFKMVEALFNLDHKRLIPTASLKLVQPEQPANFFNPQVKEAPVRGKAAAVRKAPAAPRGVIARNVVLSDVHYWTMTTFPWQAEIEKINEEVFKNYSFRPNQRAIINAALSKKDVFALMPTGYGKSLCFQLPAAFNKGITFVVSPLISLIHDQMNAMHRLGIKAIGLYGSKRIDTTLSEIAEDNRIKLVYTTPEKLITPAVLTRLPFIDKKRGIERFVIDEVHCVSKWGNDFRKSYLELIKLRETLPAVPFQTFTATASKDVVEDIFKHLKMRTPEFFKSSFNRQNLFIQVIAKRKGGARPIVPRKVDALIRADSFSGSEAEESEEEKKGKAGGKGKKKAAGKSQPKKGGYSRGRFGKSRNNSKNVAAEKTSAPGAVFDIADMIRKNYRYSAGIVYCLTIKETELVARALAGELAPTRVESYHSKKSEKEKDRILKEFMNDDITIIVATIAFGMGINKSDIRYVIHYNLPKTLEDYYQEIGRAGRDGQPSVCTLYYDPADKSRLDFLMDMNKKSKAAVRRNNKVKLLKVLLFCEVSSKGEI